MLTANELLVEDEQHIADYNVEIARWKDRRWVSTIPPLYVIVSDQRVILQPHTRKRHEPAIIPHRYLKQVKAIESGPRRGVLIDLRTSHRIALLVSGDPKATLLANLQTAVEQSRKRAHKIDAKHDLDLGGIQKLIDFFVTL